MAAYYNEFEPYAAEWLRNLIKAGLIPDGEVDTRSIVDVSADDLRAFSQCHFFAGIGGWAHALRLAGWPDDRPIWTGSCPCQPFSVAGKGLGADDPRHLWPHFFRLIRAVRPPVVMGEQVAGAGGYGWFDGVAADLENENYASRAVDVPACAVNAPHIRSRLYWVASDVADAASGRRKPFADARHGSLQQAMDRKAELGEQPCSNSTSPLCSDMADAQIIRREERERKDGQQDARSGCKGGMDVAGTVEGHMADTDEQRSQGRVVLRERGDERSAWSDGVEWAIGADGKARRVKPGVRLLAHGVPARVGKLRAYGNAIVPQVAAEVIKAYMEAAQ